MCSWISTGERRDIPRAGISLDGPVSRAGLAAGDTVQQGELFTCTRHSWESTTARDAAHPEPACAAGHNSAPNLGKQPGSYTDDSKWGEAEDLPAPRN